MAAKQISAALVASLMLGASSVGALAQEVTIKGVSAFAEGTNFSKSFEALIDRVNEQGKGVIQIEYLGGGGKVMNPFELGNAIRTGVVDIGNLPGAFYTNLLPEADALKMTTAPMAELRENGSWAYFNDLHEENVNAYFLARQKDRVPFHLYLNKEIDGMDLSGLKIRVTPIYRSFFESMGATAVRTAPGEVFAALERGVVDGYGWPIQGVFDLGWHEVTKYRVDPGFYNAAVEVLVNLDTWNGLTDAQKDVLSEAAAWLEQVGGEEDSVLNESEAQRQADFGIQVITMDADAYLKQATDSAWATIEETSPEHGPALRELLSQ